MDNGRGFDYKGLHVDKSGDSQAFYPYKVWGGGSNGTNILARTKRDIKKMIDSLFPKEDSHA